MAVIQQGRASKRLFHVEDSACMRERVRELAQLSGIKVVGFSDCADDAIRQIRLIKPDLVVLDLQLAEGSGVDILREFASGAVPSMCIVLTNHSDFRFRELSRKAGARWFFDKSTELEEFGEFLKKILP